MSLLISYSVKLNVLVKIGCFCVSRKLASGTEMPEKMPNKIRFNSDFFRRGKIRKDRPLMVKFNKGSSVVVSFSDVVMSSCQGMESLYIKS